MRHDQNWDFSCGLAVVLYLCVAGSCRSLLCLDPVLPGGVSGGEEVLFQLQFGFQWKHRSASVSWDCSGAVCLRPCWSTQIGEPGGGGVIAPFLENLLLLSLSVLEFSPEHLESLMFWCIFQAGGYCSFSNGSPLSAGVGWGTAEPGIANPEYLQGRNGVLVSGTAADTAGKRLGRACRWCGSG